MDSLQLGNVTVANQKQFLRAKHGRVVFTSLLYTKATHTIDYCVKYADGHEHIQFGLINRYLFKDSGDATALVEELHLSDQPVITGRIVKDRCHGIRRVVESNIYRLVPLRNVVDKCVYIDLPHISAVVEPPNHYERD